MRMASMLDRRAGCSSQNPFRAAERTVLKRELLVTIAALDDVSP